jgi:hypothetical protein
MRKPKFYEWLTVVLPRLVSDIACDVREIPRYLRAITEDAQSIARYCHEEDIRRQLAPQNKKPVTVQVTGTAVGSEPVQRRWTEVHGETIFCVPGEEQKIQFHPHNGLGGPLQLSCHGGVMTEIRIGVCTYLQGSCVTATLDGPVHVSQLFQVSVRAL